MFMWGVAVLPTSLGTQGGPGHIRSVFVLGLSSFGVAAPQTATGLGCIALRSVSKEKGVWWAPRQPWSSEQKKTKSCSHYWAAVG